MQDEPEELIWPEAEVPQEYAGLPPLTPRAGPDWAEAPTDPQMPALPREPEARRQVAAQPGQSARPAAWPPPERQAAAPAAEGWLDRARKRQLSVGCGALAALLLLGVCALAAMTSGLPFFGGGASPTQGVQANPVKPATPLPASTATLPAVATPTSVPTATSAPTSTATPTTSPSPEPTATPLPSPSPTASPAPTATPALTATPRQAPSPTATPRATPTR